ncbi:gluzincin family metallopeptidase [Solicola gregarius]|uniref:DUF1570 domain-containing protein n=1 Tax=Solicola gregarius TaxID=2908642 RepID=A0AA46TIC7_9ACTN|nr:hypothetical protein [Solicola gregarius]UYM05404.1 hypothetical protein L0C25_23320 [Solicola gregarius]
MSTTVRAVRSANVWALLVVAVVVLGFVVWQQRESSPSEAQSSTASALSPAGAVPDASALPNALDRLESAWQDRDRDEFIAAAGKTAAAERWGAQTYDNLQELGAGRIDLELVDDDAAAQAGTGGTFDASVDVSWVPGATTGLPRRRTDMATVSVKVRQTQRFNLEGVAATKDPMPLWLAGALDVTRDDNSTLVRVDGGAEKPKMRPMVDKAMADVRRVYGKPKRDAFVVIPRDSTQSSAIVGGSSDRLSQIAAITTTLDGSDATYGPVAVVVNPDIFTPLDERAAQIVLTHEATHEATGAATAVAPLWVAEGYADFVALNRDKLQPTRSASQILQRVRTSGPPKALPSDNEFGTASPRLGATYEGAWMAFRMLGEAYGDDAVTEFYGQVLRGTSADVAARRAFGTDIDSITADWRGYLDYWSEIPR